MQVLRSYCCLLFTQCNSWNMCFLLKYGSWKPQLELWNTNHESFNWTLPGQLFHSLLEYLSKPFWSEGWNLLWSAIARFAYWIFIIFSLVYEFFVKRNWLKYCHFDFFVGYNGIRRNFENVETKNSRITIFQKGRVWKAQRFHVQVLWRLWLNMSEWCCCYIVLHTCMYI